MNEEEIVRIFLENGYQLSKYALPLVSTNPQRIVFELGKLKPRPFIVTAQHVNKILREMERPKLRVEKIKEYKPLKKPITVEDYTQALHSRYEKIKPILTKRLATDKLMSINKITPKTSIFSVIGVVREKTENNLIVEDPTGEATVYFDGGIKDEIESIIIDDIIGLTCKKIKGRYCTIKVVFPDIASSREINRTVTDTSIVVVYEPLGLENSEYQKLVNILSTTKLSSVFIFTDFFDERLNKDFSGFGLVSVSKNSYPTLFQIDSVKVLILPKHFFKSLPEKLDSTNFLVSILQRRNIPTIFSPDIYVGNTFVLEEPPDIIISNFSESAYKNYKGTTIISNSNSNKIFLVNLKTREVTEKAI